MKNIIWGGLVGIVVALSGCGDSTNNQVPAKAQEKPRSAVEDVVISGYPLSVASAMGGEWSSVATVLKIKEKYVLASALPSYYSEDVAKAVALIQSEISDGDDEPIELCGHYENGRFLIKTVRANGYEVQLGTDCKCK